MKDYIVVFKGERRGEYHRLRDLNVLRTDNKIYFYTGRDGIVAQYELDEIETIITVETPVEGLAEMLAGAAALEQKIR